ncbi:MAG: hypothetical protein BM564_04020 [Bacteroidetes bacterium MedPE-SWsnd-G2]|nr:MAG: hypothetical protein BM564_04020 [Bacteroidetes bacterium MedPE-SWsnd-G2]
MKETFKTIAVFQYSSEAQIIKGMLEAQDIPVFMADQFTIDTDPLISNAIGGVKLKVYSEDFDKAQHHIKSVGDYAVSDQGEALNCPVCNSSKIDLFSTIKDFKSLFAFIVGALFGTLPLYTRHKYRCENCNTEFDLK